MFLVEPKTTRGLVTFTRLKSMRKTALAIKPSLRIEMEPNIRIIRLIMKFKIKHLQRRPNAPLSVDYTI